LSVATFLVDTDVISETAKARPDPAVVRWLERQSICLSTITVFELARGIDVLRTGQKRSFLEAWLSALLEGPIEVLAFDGAAALAAARVDADGRRRGTPTDLRDLFILASAKAASLSVATRNVSHFRGHGVPIYDPFSGLGAH
jgi:predicted nucleic acid-binding protein